MTRRVVVASQKGGVGKTTICLNLAVALAESGRRTLLVDLDPQGAVGLSLRKSETDWAGLAEYLMGQIHLSQAIIETKLPNLSILPRGRLDPIDVTEYERAMMVPGLLTRVLNEVDSAFDYVIIDTPAGVGAVTRSALGASHYVVLPTQAEPLAMRSLSQVLRVLEYVRAEENSNLQLLGILPTMVDLRQDFSAGAMLDMWDGLVVMDTILPRAEVFPRASAEGLPIGFLAGKTPQEATRFDRLAAEIETRIMRIEGTSGVEDEKPRRELV